MKKVVINNVEYEVIRNDQDCIDIDLLQEKITDYFDAYDYIFGDYAYEKVRLKGYYDSNNKKIASINLNGGSYKEITLVSAKITKINVANNIIYYLDESDDTSRIYKIYRIKNNGKKVRNIEY